MNNSHPILLEYYNNYQGGSKNLVGGIPWYYYFWPGYWFTSNKIVSSTLDNTNQSDNFSNKNPLLKDEERKKPRILPSLVKLNVILYNPSSKGGYSEDIIPIIKDEYNLGKYNFKNNKPESDIKIDFTIVKSMDRGILYGAGTFTAVYKIKDNNKTINDPNITDDMYILRLVTRDNNTHMYDNPKIKREYELFNKYLPRIYYYGNFIVSNNIYYYTITKLYNDFPIINNYFKIPKILSNTDKFVFFYNNIVMLNDLLKKNYTHFDYKLSNIGFEKENNNINIILIDYDEKTLQELSVINNIFNVNNDQKVTLAYAISTYVPSWLIYNKFVPIDYFKKYCTIGLYKMLNNLSIKFKIKNKNENENDIYIITTLPNFEKLNKNYLFKKFILLNHLYSNDALHLNNDNYWVIPTYELLLEIFEPIMNNKEMYLL